MSGAVREAFRAAVRRAGLGDLPPDELALLQHYFDGWRAQVAQLRGVLEPADEPATVFVAAPPPSGGPRTAAGPDPDGGAGR